MEPSPADEGRHPAGAGSAGWEEWWDLEFHTADAGLGGYVRLGLWPLAARAWLWAGLVGDGRSLVSVVDHELPLPQPPGLDLRAEGLWTSLTCEVALEHWSVGLEAFGVGLDDPTEAYRSGRGDRVALGLDLEWETTGPATGHPHPAGYHLPCLVHGEVLVGPEVITFDGWGGRTHVWGSPPMAGEAWCTTSGRLDDGSVWHGDTAAGFALLGDDGLPRAGRFAVPADQGDVAVEPLHHAPVQMVGPGGRTGPLARSLCRYATPDGRRGAGWSEWHQSPVGPPPGLA